ncbi:MAG: hypothetical protein IJP69_01850 [Synergistaceae bacterium]|nr:hypothetical protein [Synergistaceae bacterium]
MKLFKFLMLSMFLFVACAFCSSAWSATRVAVSFFSFIDEDNVVDYTSQAELRRRDKLSEQCKKLFMAELSNTGMFEVVEITSEEYMKEIMEETQAMAPQRDKNGEYKPYYRKKMSTKADDMNFTEFAINNQIAGNVKMAKDRNCRYLINGVVMYGKTSVYAGIMVYDAENPPKNLKDNHFQGYAQIKTLTEKKSASKAKTSSSKSKSRKSKKEKNSVDEQIREQEISKAFAKAIANFQDSVTGDVAKITKIVNNDVFINRGTKSKVEIGDTYIVKTQFDDGLDDVFGTTDESSKTVSLAIIQVKDVYEDSSVAEIIPDGGYITTLRVDDVIDPMRSAGGHGGVDEYLDKVKSGKLAAFPSQRPEVKKVEIQPTVAKSTSKKTSDKSLKKEKTSSALKPLPALPPGVMRIAVMQFDSKTEGVSAKGAASITDILSRTLSNSDKIVIVERNRLEAIKKEHKLNLAGLIDAETAAQIGKLIGCQYVLVGSVTEMNERDTVSGRYIRPTPRADYSKLYTSNMSSTAAGIFLGLQIISDIAEANNAKKENIVTETHELLAKVDVRLVEAATSQVKMAFTEQGSAAQSDVVTQDGNGVLKNVEVDFDNLENRAIASVATNIGHRIREVLVNEPVQISSVNDKEIIINRGSSSGVQVDDLFCVYAEGQNDGDTEAVISVKEVQDAFSIAEVKLALSNSYSPSVGSRLEPVLYSDYQRGIWHIKNQKNSQASDKNKQDISLEGLLNNSTKRKRFENSSTDAKKVIRSYGYNAKKENSLINAHLKAAKGSSAKNKYEAYKKLSDADMSDYLAAYNTGRYAFELSMYIEAREWASKALFVNPNYQPAKTLIEKIDNGD